MNTSEFNWKLEQEIYRFVFGRWDVCKAKEIIVAEPREIITANLYELRHYVIRPKGNEITPHRIDWAKVDSDEVDIEFPLIGVSLDVGPWIIDGWHRMAKGFEKDIKDYPVALLTKHESKLVML